MDTPNREKEAPKGAINTPVTASSQGVSRPTQASGSPSLRGMAIALIIVIGLGLGVYFLAINPRLQNNKELAAIAASAGQKTVTVSKTDSV